MKIKASLKTKIIFSILIITLTFVLLAGYVTSSEYTKTSNEQYRTILENLAETTAIFLDANLINQYTDEVVEIYSETLDNNTVEENSDEYYELYSSVYDSQYETLSNQLYEIQEANNILDLCIVYVDTNSDNFVYIIDSKDPSFYHPAGECSPIDYTQFSLYDNSSNTTTVYTAETEAGFVASISEPIINDNGETIANVSVIISIDAYQANQSTALFELSAILIATAILMISFFVIISNKFILKPIKKISNATNSYIDSNSSNLTSLENLSISTGDEIEDLSNAMKQMDKDIKTYIENIKHITSESEKLSTELNIASHIQASMLPNIFPPFPDRKEFDIYASSSPAKEVGGDFYDFFLLDEDHLALVIADVSGKGIPASLFMVISKTLLKDHAQTGISPKEILKGVNNKLCEGNSEEMFVTVWLGIYEISTGKLTASNGGHEYPAIKRKDGQFELLKDKHGFVLGGLENSPYSEYEINLNKGDVLFVYTDGVVEATDGNLVMFGTEAMLASLDNHCNKSMEDLLKGLNTDIDDFVGEAMQFDDLTMLGFKINE